MVEDLSFAIVCSDQSRITTIDKMIGSIDSAARRLLFPSIEAALGARIRGHFDALLYCAHERSLQAWRSLPKFSKANDFTAVIMAYDTKSDDDLPFLVNECRVDWIMDFEFVEAELATALSEAKQLIIANKRRRNIQFSEDIISVSRKATTILDRNFRIVHANDAAKILFEAQDPFDISAVGQLNCTNDVETKKFHDALSASLHKQIAEKKTTYIRVQRRDCQFPIVVGSIPVSSFLTDRYAYHVIFNDAAKAVFVSAEDYADALGITNSEARLVAELVDGNSINVASTNLNITETTARSYLRSIFDKVSVSKQGALVRLAILATQ